MSVLRFESLLPSQYPLDDYGGRRLFSLIFMEINFVCEILKKALSRDKGVYSYRKKVMSRT